MCIINLVHNHLKFKLNIDQHIHYSGAEKNGPKGASSQLAANQKAMSLKCKICMQTFMMTQKSQLPAHVDSKHPKAKWADCFPDIPDPKA